MTVGIGLTLFFILSPKSLEVTSSSTTTAEYAHLLFNKDKVAEINIQMDKTNWDWILENATNEEYRNADITINGETFYNVGIRPKGNSSLSMVARDNTTNRFSFKIKFDKYVKEQSYYGLDELVINNMMSDTTYMKEYLSYDLFEKMGITTPLYAFSNIRINDEPWGLYLAVEGTKESFLKRNFEQDYGNLYKPEDKGSSLMWVDEKHSNYQGIKDNAQTEITSRDFDKVVEMIKHLNEGIDLEKYLDVDEILRYFAVNTLLVNQDSYISNFHHNYLLYEKNGIFSVFPWDLNMSFAGFQVEGAQQAVDLAIDRPYSGSAENYPLMSKLLEVPEYKERYSHYLEEAVQLYFKSGLFKATIDQVDGLINEYVKNDATAFYSYEEYKASLPVLKEFGKLRANSVLAQLEGEATAGTVALDLKALGSMGGGGDRPDDMPKEAAAFAPNEKSGPPNFENREKFNQDKSPQPPENGPGQVQDRNLREENHQNKNPIRGQGTFGRGMEKKGQKERFIVLFCILIMIVAIVYVKQFKRYKYLKGTSKA